MGRAGGEFEIVQRALEELLVGQYGERRCASVFEFGGEFGHVEVGADKSFGGRGLFEFGDDGRPRPVRLAASARESRADDDALLRPNGSVMSTTTFSGGYACAGRGDDFFQLGRHGVRKV